MAMSFADLFSIIEEIAETNQKNIAVKLNVDPSVISRLKKGKGKSNPLSEESDINHYYEALFNPENEKGLMYRGLNSKNPLNDFKGTVEGLGLRRSFDDELWDMDDQDKEDYEKFIKTMLRKVKLRVGKIPLPKALRNMETEAASNDNNFQTKATDIETFFLLVYKLVDFCNFSVKELQTSYDRDMDAKLNDPDPNIRRFHEETLYAFGQTPYTPNARSLYTNNKYICAFLDSLKISGGKVEFKELISSFKHLRISKLSGDIISNQEYENERKSVYLYSDITEEDWEQLTDEAHDFINMREEEWDETNGEPKEFINPMYRKFYLNEDLS